jgi:hypothetical protein
LSYNQFKIQSDSLQNNSTVYLVPSVTELDEVVISPNTTDILFKAIHNLFVNFQKEKNQTYYLTHVEGNATTGGEKEIYAMIEADLFNINVEGRKSLKWYLKLTQLDRIKIIRANDFTIKGRDISARIFLDDLQFPVVSKDSSDSTAAICEIYENNDEELTLKVYPPYIDNENFRYFLWTINKKDTILTKILSQSYSNSDTLTEREFKGVSYTTTNHFQNIEFAKDLSGLYYLDKFQQLVTNKILTDTPYAVTFKILTHSIENVSDDIKKKNKISYPYESLLFKSKFPDSPGFWKKYVNPE